MIDQKTKTLYKKFYDTYKISEIIDLYKGDINQDDVISIYSNYTNRLVHDKEATLYSVSTGYPMELIYTKKR